MITNNHNDTNDADDNDVNDEGPQSVTATPPVKVPIHNNCCRTDNDNGYSCPSKLDTITVEDALERIGMGPFQNRIFWAAGLCTIADSMEILLLSFLAVVLQSQWHLTTDETSLITASVFLGAFSGSILLGQLGDSVGRKPIFTVTTIIIAFFGVLTGLANNMTTLILIRGFTGFGIGGLTVPFDALAELVPTSHRGLNLCWMSAFWSFGTIATPLLAYLTIGGGGGGETRAGASNSSESDNGWRYFVVLCAVPCVLSTLYGLCYVPESPRWLITKGRHGEALAILRTAAAVNGKDPDAILPQGISILDQEEHGSDSAAETAAAVHTNNCCHLFSRKWRTTTLFMWMVWAGFAFSYYGCIQATTLIFSSSSSTTTTTDIATTAESTDTTTNTTSTYTFDYAGIMATSSSEIVATIFVLIAVEYIGRVPIQVFSYTLGGLFTLSFCLLAASSNHYQQDEIDIAAAGLPQQQQRWALIALAFLARCAFSAGTTMTWTSTPEILSTEIRTTGNGAANAIARLGGAVSPFLVNSSTPYTIMGGVVLATSLVTAMACSMLPETRNKALGNVVHQHEEPQLEDVTESEII